MSDKLNAVLEAVKSLQQKSLDWGNGTVSVLTSNYNQLMHRLAEYEAEQAAKRDAPPIVCLCQSTQFKQAWIPVEKVIEALAGCRVKPEKESEE